jgi:hypothetical protein
MSTFSWPLSLPQHVGISSYQERFAETSLRTPMEAGVAKVRRRYTAAPRQFDMSIRMTAEQVSLLRDFYEETCAGGTLAFDWVHPRNLQPATFRFLDTPRVSASSPISFLVALKLEEMP